MSFVILEAVNENSGLDVRKQYTVEEKRADEIIILSQGSQKSRVVPSSNFIGFAFRGGDGHSSCQRNVHHLFP